MRYPYREVTLIQRKYALPEGQIQAELDVVKTFIPVQENINTFCLVTDVYNMHSHNFVEDIFSDIENISISNTYLLFNRN